MASIFDLKQSAVELKDGNMGIADLTYQQVTSTRGPLQTTATFASSQQQFSWEMGPNKWWLPSRSYMRIRCNLTDAAGNQLVQGAGIGPNMGLAGNLYKAGEMKINNSIVSSIPEGMAQIDAVVNRQRKSKAYLDGVGASTNWWQPRLSERIAEVSSDGTTLVEGPAVSTQTGRAALGFDAAGAANRNTAAYDQNTGIITFAQNNGAALPANVRDLFPPGSYFMYTGGTSVATSSGVAMKVITGVNGAPGGSPTSIVVEPLLAQAEDGNPAAAADFVRVDISDGRPASRRAGGFELIWQPPLSLFSYPGALPNGRYDMVLTPEAINQIQIVAIESLADESAGANYRFNIVDAFMYICTVTGPNVMEQDFVIDHEAIDMQLDNTKYAAGAFVSKQFSVSPSTYQLSVGFQDGDAGGNTTLYSESKFKVRNNYDLGLSRFHIQYSGAVLPSPDYDGSYKNGAGPLAFSDFTTQMYYESIMYGGAFFSEGSAESLRDWQERGPLYTFKWPKPAGDKSTRVQVYYQFPGAVANDASLKTLLFSHSRKVTMVSIRGGQVQRVTTVDA